MSTRWPSAAWWHDRGGRRGCGGARCQLRRADPLVRLATRRRGRRRRRRDDLLDGSRLPVDQRRGRHRPRVRRTRISGSPRSATGSTRTRRCRGAGWSGRRAGRSISASGFCAPATSSSATALGWRSTSTTFEPERAARRRRDRDRRRPGRPRRLGGAPAARTRPRRHAGARLARRPRSRAECRRPVARLDRAPRRRPGRGRRALRRGRRGRHLQRRHRARGARSRHRTRAVDDRRPSSRPSRAATRTRRPRFVRDGLPGLPSASGSARSRACGRTRGAPPRARAVRPTDRPGTPAPRPAGARRPSPACSRRCRSGPVRSRVMRPPRPLTRPRTAKALVGGGLRVQPVAHQVGRGLRQDHGDDPLAVAGGRRGAGRVVRVEPGADERRVPHPPGRLERHPAGRRPGGEVACAVQGDRADRVAPEQRLDPVRVGVRDPLLPDGAFAVRHEIVRVAGLDARALGELVRAVAR